MNQWTFTGITCDSRVQFIADIEAHLGDIEASGPAYCPASAHAGADYVSYRESIDNRRKPPRKESVAEKEAECIRGRHVRRYLTCYLLIFDRMTRISKCSTVVCLALIFYQAEQNL